MNDMSAVIIPKSDQINADDLISGPMTITIKEVRIKRGEEQPVDIYFDGSEKAYRPCKSMSRVLVHIWGPDAGKYIGNSLTLYRDPTVRFGKDAVGGIRISHMTNIPGDRLDNGRVVMSLTATRAQRKPHVIKPLLFEDAPPKQDAAANFTRAYLAKVEEAEDRVELEKFVESKAAKLEELKAKRPDLYAEINVAVGQRRNEFAPEGKSESDTGEAFATDDDAGVDF